MAGTGHSRAFCFRDNAHILFGRVDFKPPSTVTVLNEREVKIYSNFIVVGRINRFNLHI